MANYLTNSSYFRRIDRGYNCISVATTTIVIIIIIIIIIITIMMMIIIKIILGEYRGLIFYAFT